jgi:hypothetical protein
MIPPIAPGLRIIEASGIIGREFHRWLQLIAQAVSSTYIGDQSPGRSYSIKDGQFAIHAKRLTLAGSERLTIGVIVGADTSETAPARMVLCG